jgi:translation initiation factor 2B subunit (eIF-2B alpha/beta/delta family)
MDKKLNKIVNDKTSGSTDLLLKLSRLLKEHLDNKDQLKLLLSEAGESFKSFGIIENYIKEVKKALSSRDFNTIEKAVISPLENENIYSLIFRAAFLDLKNIQKVFTFSNSKTVLEIIKLLHRENIKLEVSVTESRPKNEGRILASKLLKENIKVKFSADAAMAALIENCDAVFFGADKILKDGGVVNKTGSLNAAIAAEYYNKPVYVFAGSVKVSESFSKDYRDPYEVWRKTDKNLELYNDYFEIIPPGLITRIFMEK